MNNSLHTIDYLNRWRAADLDREIALRLSRAERPPRPIELPETTPARRFGVWMLRHQVAAAPRAAMRPRTH
ncbi:hypothetical protein ACFQRL_01670 [Microbacterium fluvii]|uniref:Uncharacterized protein n=1 Tax=Microbacterium fluvii TaxID=415215 RepID=A0ABW2HD37_9MICO|nr:hypothetical protein [Microbacterium fluvii]MCU4671296.1 hypothetical protein [Microbacterium fluvii]